MKEQILKTVENYLEVNRECLLDPEIVDLENQIRFLKEEIYKEKLKAYVQQLKDFHNHMLSTFEAFMGEDITNETVDSFYNMDFRISFNGKTVRIGNGAEVFQGIEEIILNEIDEFGEV